MGNSRLRSAINHNFLLSMNVDTMFQPDAMDCSWSSTSNPVTNWGSGVDCAAGDACAAGGTNCNVPVELPTPESSVSRFVVVVPALEGLAGAAAGAAADMLNDKTAGGI